MKRLLLILHLLMITSASAADEVGKRIYLQGLSEQGQVIKAYINDLESGAALACVNCHRESGLGTSESGKTIPPVSWKFLGVNQPADDSSIFYRIQNKRKAYDNKLLHRLLTSGINSNGEAADPLMPRYVISEEQSEYLVEYLKTLYADDDPGVDSEIIKIATIVDPRLPALQKQQHLQFLQGLFDMKNSLTRGELKRKKYSPIQKVPQYESYRKWQLITWELPEDTNLWADSLSQYYREEPVFVVLSPLITGDYAPVGNFCSEMKLPCLFVHGTDSASGDYYNFVYRDTAKQQRDYLLKKIREEKNKLFFLDTNGVFQKVSTANIDFTETKYLSESMLIKQFNDVCSENKTIILKSDLTFAKQLYEQTCPVEQEIKIKLLMDDSVNFQNLNEFLKTHSSPDICWVTDYGKMLQRNTRIIRTKVLTRKFGMENTDSENLLMNLYSYGLLTDSIHQLAGNFSRAYLMEIIEHMLNSYPNYTYFNYVSGAPKQRAIVGSVSEYCPTTGES